MPKPPSRRNFDAGTGDCHVALFGPMERANLARSLTVYPTSGQVKKNMPMSATSSGAQRDLRIDFFRGLALLFIFVDHVPTTWPPNSP